VPVGGGTELGGVGATVLDWAGAIAAGSPEGVVAAPGTAGRDGSGGVGAPVPAGVGRTVVVAAGSGPPASAKPMRQMLKLRKDNM